MLYLTTDHPASSYGDPVLFDKVSHAVFGRADVLPINIGGWREPVTAAQWVAERLACGAYDQDETAYETARLWTRDACRDLFGSAFVPWADKGRIA